MGTRHLICIVKDDKYKVAQYGQWDGYPSGQGQKIVDFLRSSKFQRTVFCRHLDNIRHLSDEEVRATYEQNEENWREKYPHLERSFGSHVLGYIQDTAKPETHLELSFAADSLFCEWCYVLNMDTDELEIYAGFNTTPLNEAERFGTLPPCKYPTSTKMNTYYPVRLAKKIKFTDLDDSWAEGLLSKEDD